jgi:hypothetical protein
VNLLSLNSFDDSSISSDWWILRPKTAMMYSDVTTSVRFSYPSSKDSNDDAAPYSEATMSVRYSSRPFVAPSARKHSDDDAAPRCCCSAPYYDVMTSVRFIYPSFLAPSAWKDSNDDAAPWWCCSAPY